MIISFLYAILTMIVVVFSVVFFGYVLFCIIVSVLLSLYYITVSIYQFIRKVLNKR